MKIVWSPIARDDLAQLRTFIAETDPRAAGSIAGAILDSVERLRAFPAMGRPGRLAGTRELVMPGTPFVIPYRVTRGTVEIIAVLHGARRWPTDVVR